MHKLYIPSFHRAKSICTHLLLDTAIFDYYIVVHDPLELHYYKQNKTIPPERLICSYAPYGISHQRQWIRDNLTSDGEWFCMADDNIKFIHAVRKPEYFEEDLEKINTLAFQKNDNNFKYSVYENKIDSHRLGEICEEMILEAQKLGIKYCAFASNRNYFFARARKWSYWSYAISKFAIYQKDDINFDLNVQAMDDYCFTAQNILQYGKVLVNKFVYAHGIHYQKGGIGRYEERQEKKVADAAYLMLKYPGLFRYKIKKGCHPEAEIQMRFNYQKQIDAWRKGLQVESK